MGDRDFEAALDALLDHVAIGVPIRDEHGTIVDFRLAYLNAASVDGAGRTREELVGGRLLERFPDFGENGMLDPIIEVVETGRPWAGDRVAYQGTTPDGRAIDGYFSLRVVPFGDGYLAVTRDETRAVREEEERAALRLEAEVNRLAVLLLTRAALPATLPQVPNVAIAARYQPTAPTQPVGGDWYDAFTLADGRLGVVIADVTGHGPEAAAYMVQVRNVVRALAVEHGEPARVLDRANRVLLDLDEQGLFATCAYHVLDPVTGVVRWCRAGHFEPLLLGAGGDRYLTSPPGLPLGVGHDVRYRAGQAQLAPGDRLVLFTDGLLRERDGGVGRALATFEQTAATWLGLSAEATVEAALAQAPGCDDVAVVCLRYER
jgi:hypothetical protein